MLKVYPSGTISGGTYHSVTDWRNEISRLLRGYAEILSPMRGKDYLLKEASIKDCYDQHINSTGKAIVQRDRFDVARCDIFLLNLLKALKVSIGTMIELGWATSAPTPKIIILVMENGNIHEHRFVRELAGWHVQTLDEAVDIIKIIASTEEYREALDHGKEIIKEVE
jgi:nucleoside 2-deoxyribosyltransferase